MHGCAHAPQLSRGVRRSEEHTSELQSLTNLVCRLLLEKKKERLLIMNPGDAIDVDDLREVVRLETRPPVGSAGAAPETYGNHLAPRTLREFKEATERRQ